jgi:GAF domain-containing protein
LHTEMQKRLVEQSALRETATTLLSTLNTEKVLTRIAEQMAKTLAGTSAYILLFEKEKMKVQVLAEYITQQACAAERISDLGESYGIEYDENLLDCLQAGKTDIAQVNDPDLAETDLEHMRKYGAKTILYIPLQVKGELVAYAELWESRFQRTFNKPQSPSRMHGYLRKPRRRLDSANKLSLHYGKAKNDMPSPLKLLTMDFGIGI